jgi:ATP-binding cassette subfamily B multidrug efflux pump
VIIEDEATGRAYDHRLMRRLLGFLRPYRLEVAFAGAVVIVDALVTLVYPWLTKEAIDHGIRRHDLRFLDRVAVVYVALLAVGFLLGYLQNQIVQRVGQRVMLDLRTALFRKLQALPVAYFDRHPIGRIMTRLTGDVDVLNELVTAGVGALFGDLIALIGIVIAMCRLNAELLGVTFSVLPLIVVVTLVFRSRVRASFRDIRVRLARLNAFLNENLSGMSTVQMLNREARNFEQFRVINAEHRDANLRANFYYAVFFPLLELVGAVAVSLIVWYGGRQVMWTGITLGTLVAFIQYTQRFFRPISDLSEKYNILQQAMASSERIFQLLDEPEDSGARTSVTLLSEPVDAARAGVPGELAPVEFDHVWFAYQDEHWVLEDVSFTIHPGERVALVGATGAGKSTITSLLLRFYEPQRGEIRVGGRPLAEWDVADLRAGIGMVLQDAFLFSGTIAGNLRLGNETMPFEAMERVAAEVHAHEFIQRLPGGYDAPVHERGATLSAGQRQLLSCARALARNPELLVLDEATSSVDPHTERLIQDALHRLLSNRTSLVIAHRLSTIQDVDRIVVLHHGRVRESGRHAELLAVGGIYARLHELQFLGAADAPRRVVEPVSDEGIEEPGTLDARAGWT